VYVNQNNASFTSFKLKIFQRSQIEADRIPRAN